MIKATCPTLGRVYVVDLKARLHLREYKFKLFFINTRSGDASDPFGKLVILAFFHAACE